MRSADNTQFFRTGDDDIQRIKLNVTDANGAFDEALLAFAPEATDGWDRLYDGLKIPGNGMNIYTTLEDMNYGIQAYAPVQENKVIPVTLTSSATGEMTISFSTENFAAETGLWLEDRERNVWVNLRKEEPYNFTLDEEAAILANRFFVHVNVESIDQPQTSTGISNHMEDWIDVFAFQHSIVIRSSNVLDGQLQVINLLGQVVYSQQLSGGNEQHITLDMAEGNYIARYMSDISSQNTKVYLMR